MNPLLILARLSVIVLFAILGVVNTALADNDADHVQAKKLRDAGAILPLETILKNAKKLRSGRILEIELEDEHERYIYELEVLDEKGVVWEMKFDAKTGKLIETERDE